jgi:hypothetical protein
MQGATAHPVSGVHHLVRQLIEAEVVLETVRRQGLNQVVVSHDGHDAMNVLYVLSSTVCIYVLFMQ